MPYGNGSEAGALTLESCFESSDLREGGFFSGWSPPGGGAGCEGGRDRAPFTDSEDD